VVEGVGLAAHRLHRQRIGLVDRAPLGETGGTTVSSDHAGMVFYQTRGPADKRGAVKLAKLCRINRS
jgi:hypothetical protein